MTLLMINNIEEIGLKFQSVAARFNEAREYLPLIDNKVCLAYTDESGKPIFKCITQESIWNESRSNINSMAEIDLFRYEADEHNPADIIGVRRGGTMENKILRKLVPALSFLVFLVIGASAAFKWIDLSSFGINVSLKMRPTASRQDVRGDLASTPGTPTSRRVQPYSSMDRRCTGWQ